MQALHLGNIVFGLLLVKAEPRVDFQRHLHIIFLTVRKQRFQHKSRRHGYQTDHVHAKPVCQLYFFNQKTDTLFFGQCPVIIEVCV